MRITHLNGLRALEATLRTGSFRSAADELGVTTAAVGQQIRTLESFLGRKLFLRTSTGVQPTDYARRVEQNLTVSFSTIEDVISQLKNHPSKTRLAITLPSSFAENWFTGRLSDFYKLNSKIDLPSTSREAATQRPQWMQRLRSIMMSGCVASTSASLKKYRYLGAMMSRR